MARRLCAWSGVHAEGRGDCYAGTSARMVVISALLSECLPFSRYVWIAAFELDAAGAPVADARISRHFRIHAAIRGELTVMFIVALPVRARRCGRNPNSCYDPIR